MLRDWQSRDLVAIGLRNPKITGRVSCDAKRAASGFNGLHVCEDTIGSNLDDHIDGRLCEIQVTVRPRRDSLRLGVGCGNRELRDHAARSDPANDVFELGVPGVIRGKFSVRKIATKSPLVTRHDYI